VNAMELELGLYDWSTLPCRRCKSALSACPGPVRACRGPEPPYTPYSAAGA